jgi:hypothetical protein
MIMAGTVRAACRPVRRLTRLFMSPNKLRRPSDRIEGTVVVLLSVIFLAAVAAAPWFGVRFYHSQRADAAGLRPAVAVLTQAGPGSDYFLTSGEAAARLFMEKRHDRFLCSQLPCAISVSVGGGWLIAA